MKFIGNKKLGFSLLELVVLLAVISVIVFVFIFRIEAYTKNLNDTKRLYQTQDLLKKIYEESEKGVPFNNLINVKSQNNVIIGGNHEKTNIGIANFDFLRLDGNDFKDPKTNSNYPIAFAQVKTSTETKKYLQIATVRELENLAYVYGNYILINEGDSPSLFINDGGLYVENGKISLMYSPNIKVNIKMKKGPIDGQCGESDGQIFSKKPEENFCLVGVMTNFKTNWLNGYTWTCDGLFGGKSTNCKSLYSKFSYYDTEKNIIYDSNTKLLWQKDGVSNGKMTWENAINYCKDLSLSGENDWRLPTFGELLSIVDYNLFNPSIDKRFFISSLENYWTSSSDTKDKAFYIYFFNGLSSNQEKISNNNLRCVAGSSAILPFQGSIAFKYNKEDNKMITEEAHNKRFSFVFGDKPGGKSIIFDTVTKLYWQSDGINKNNLTFLEAENYCNTLDLNSKRWRLPDIYELSSIQDFTKTNNTINTDFFTTIDGPYFSSTPLSHSPGTEILGISFLNNNIIPIPKDSKNIGLRCVYNEE